MSPPPVIIEVTRSAESAYSPTDRTSVLVPTVVPIPIVPSVVVVPPPSEPVQKFASKESFDALDSKFDRFAQMMQNYMMGFTGPQQIPANTQVQPPPGFAPLGTHQVAIDTNFLQNIPLPPPLPPSLPLPTFTRGTTSSLPEMSHQCSLPVCHCRL